MHTWYDTRRFGKSTFGSGVGKMVQVCVLSSNSVLHFSFLQSSFVFHCSFLPVQPLRIVLAVSQFHFRPHLCAGSREGTQLDRSRDGTLVNGRALCAS